MGRNKTSKELDKIFLLFKNLGRFFLKFSGFKPIK